jgi:RNA polymerase subunit RPABC4/transcription elongation factor Spt4
MTGDTTNTESVPAAVRESGWQWRPVDGDTAFAPPFGTVRACLDCGCLVAGGPTRCRRCAADVAPGEAPSVLARVADERAEHDQKHGGPERDDERFTKDWIGIIRKQLDAADMPNCGCFVVESL